MKKLIILLAALAITTNNLQSAINQYEINTAISKLTANINSNQAPNNDQINTLKANLKIASALAPGIGSLPGLIGSLDTLLKAMQTSITKCDSYSNLLEIFEKLFDTTEGSLQNLLKQWDTKSNFQQPARANYLTFYSDAADFYLKLLIAQGYVKNNEIKKPALENIDKIIGELIPNLSDETFKKDINTKTLKEQKNDLISAFNALIQNNKDFIQQYCQLQEEYAKNDWKNNKEYWKDITDAYEDDDTYDDNLWEESDKILILKNYLKQRIEPLYGADSKITQNYLDQWLGAGNNIFSMLEKEIKAAEPQKTQEQIDSEILTKYLNKVKKLFKKNLINLIDDKKFNDELTKLREKINNDALLSPETKNDLLVNDKFNPINLQDQRNFAKPLITYLIPQNIDADEAIQKMEEILLDTLNNFPQNTTSLAGAKNLATLQQNYFEIAKNIYDLNFKESKYLPKMPSPQDNTNRDIINAYIKAATLLEKKPNPNTPDRIELEKQMEIIDNASANVWRNIKAWLPSGIKDIKQEYQDFLNQKQTPISQQELLKSLTNLSVELMALKSKI